MELNSLGKVKNANDWQFSLPLLGYTRHSLAGHLGVATATEETTHSLSEMAYANMHVVVHVSRKWFVLYT